MEYYNYVLIDMGVSAVAVQLFQKGYTRIAELFCSTFEQRIAMCICTHGHGINIQAHACISPHTLY